MGCQHSKVDLNGFVLSANAHWSLVLAVLGSTTCCRAVIAPTFLFVGDMLVSGEAW